MSTISLQFQDSPLSLSTQTPRSIRVLARALWIAVVLLPFLLLFVPWQQNVRGEGRVVAYAPLDRRQRVDAPIDGRIVRWWVAEGSEVARGDPLFEITDNDPQLIDRLQGQLEALRAKLDAAQAKASSYQEQVAAFEEARQHAMRAARERVRMAEQRVTASERAVDAARIGHETAHINFERQEALRGDGLSSSRDFELARLEQRRTEAELARAEAALEAAHSDRDAMKAEVDQIAADFAARVTAARASRETALADVATAKTALLDLETRLARQQTQRVESPLDGTVLRLYANQGGEFVKGGDPVLVLVPQTQAMAVELWVDGNDMPLLSIGRRVRLQFEGWPAVQFAGWPSVAVGTFGGLVRLIDATDDGKGRFRVVIVPDPEDQEWPSRRFLRQGVQARGWILLEQVTLGFELWRNLNGFPPVIADAEPKEDERR